MRDVQHTSTLELEQDPPLKHRGVLIAGLMVAMLFGALDNTIVGTALPRIVGDLGGLGMMAWLTTAYMLASTTIVPVAGKLADLMGRKSIYLAGLLIFIIGSALCGAAQTMEQLIWFRALQGIGGGIMMPMAMIIIGDIFTGAQRAKWQGVFGAIFGLSSILGPQVGGWIVDSMNWHWVFFINLPVGILAMILISIGLKGQHTKKVAKIDYGGVVTMSGGVVSLLLALTFGGTEYPWGSWQILGLFALSAVLITLFIIIEGRAEEPILPLSLFKNKTFTVLNGIGFLMAVGMFGAIMFVPLFMQGIIGVSATESGTVMTPMMISMIITSIVGGQLVRKMGIRVQILIGMIIMGVGFFLMSTMGMDTTKWMAMGYMIILGLGMGLVMPLLTLALQESFPKSELGVVTSSSQFFRQIGGTFGMTILGVVMNTRSSELLTQRMVPELEKLPAQAHSMVTQFESMINTNAQGLFSALLNPEALNKIPEMVQQVILPPLKSSLVDALQSVFVIGLVFIILGILLTPFIGKIKLSEAPKRSRKKKDETTITSLEN